MAALGDKSLELYLKRPAGLPAEKFQAEKRIFFTTCSLNCSFHILGEKSYLIRPKILDIGGLILKWGMGKKRQGWVGMKTDLKGGNNHPLSPPLAHV